MVNYSLKTVIVDNLVKKYGKVIALKGISFEIYRGEVFGLLGPNGAGKTTTIRAISGALKPTSGKIFVLGIDVIKEPLKVKKRIGVVPELPSMYPELSVRDNLYIMARFYDMSRDEFHERLEIISEQLGIKHILGIKYGHLSKGYKRRVDIAASLIHDPEIILLDEPTSGLDVFAANNLRKLLRKLVSIGKTIVLSSHYIDEVMELSNRVLLLYNGVKLFLDKPINLRRILKLKKKVKLYLAKPADRSLLIMLEKNIGCEDCRVELEDERVIVINTDKPLETITLAKQVVEENNNRVIDADILPPSWEDVFIKYIEPLEKRECGQCPLASTGVCG